MVSWRGRCSSGTGDEGSGSGGEGAIARACNAHERLYQPTSQELDDQAVRRMAGDADLVKVEEETIKTSTAIVGGAAGFLFGGPVCSAIPPSSAILPS